MAPDCSGFIGVFDSGVGGISVLRSLVDVLPQEDFRFFGDSAHAPYGTKSRETVIELSRNIVGSMVDDGAKAIVIACNTATSAAAELLRQEYPAIPIIGVEPALKPAAIASGNGRILVMATPITLKLDKYQQLAQRWGSGHEVIAIPCPGLADRIEQGNLDAPDLEDLLAELIGSYAGAVEAVVLGCTHYPFVSRQIRKVIGNVPLFDGSLGTAQQLQRKLAEHGLLKDSKDAGGVEFFSSIEGQDEIDLYRSFFAGSF